MEHKEDALVFEATVEVYPEVEVKAFDGLEVERKSAEIKDADVDAMIENLQNNVKLGCNQGYGEKTCKDL